MELTDKQKKEYSKRLILSRMRLLNTHGFYGLLLMHMSMALDVNCKTAATNGKKIFFGPKFLDSLTDKELDFIMMHEILHVALKHCFRQGNRNNERFNIACDIVVNSNILKSCDMDYDAIAIDGVASMHLVPGGREGYKFTAEEVYEMLPEDIGKYKGDENEDGHPKESNVDDHSKWKDEEDEYEEDVWSIRVANAKEVITNRSGSVPSGVERLVGELKKPQIDWRTILNDFIQEEVVDYSFSPPDRRYDDNPFFLPDFNEKDEEVKNILFMVDTSASMRNDMITAAYSEIKGAIDQFGGMLQGWLGFFDAEVIDPKPFTNEDDFRVIKPIGGGGTNFHIVFKYIMENMMANPPSSIIIMTDGYAAFPPEDMAMGIPVLWLLNNEKVTPPWGKVARINMDD